MTFDGKAFGAEIVAAVKTHVQDVLTPLVSRLDELEKRLGDPGKDGKDGRDGLDVKDLFRAEGGKLVAVMSDGSTKDLGVFVGKDGKDGEPGRDGLGFDDMRMEEREDGCYLVFERGEIVKDFRLPVVIDCGVYSAGKVYRKGNGVTWAGSFWIAQEDTSEKPDTGKGWRLAVKKGRDGKDGVLKAEKPKEQVKVGCDG